VLLQSVIFFESINATLEEVIELQILLRLTELLLLLVLFRVVLEQWQPMRLPVEPLLVSEVVHLALVLILIRLFTLGLGLDVCEQRPVLLTDFLLLLHYYLVNRRLCSRNLGVLFFKTSVYLGLDFGMLVLDATFREFLLDLGLTQLFVVGSRNHLLS